MSMKAEEMIDLLQRTKNKCGNIDIQPIPIKETGKEEGIEIEQVTKGKDEGLAFLWYNDED